MKDKLRSLAISCRRSVAATRLMSCALAVLWISTLIGSNRMLQGAEGPKKRAYPTSSRNGLDSRR